MAAIPVSVGFDIAGVFQTMITEQKANTQILRDIHTTLTQQTAQGRQQGIPVPNQGGSGSPIGGTNTGNLGAAGGGGGQSNPRAGQVAAGGSGGGFKEGKSGPGFLSVIPGWGIVDSVLGEIRSQRDKNARFQSIEGGSNFGGFAERAHQATYQASTMGVFSGAEASQAFYGVTQLGYNNQGSPGRQNALDFAYGAKTQRGQSVDESLAQLDTAAKAGLENFTQLTKALNDLSDAAGKAGVNSKQARAVMMGNMQQALSMGQGASASTSYASGITKTLASWGQGGINLDVSGRNSYAFAYMTAGSAGVSYQNYQASLYGKDNGALAAGARGKSDMEHIRQILPPMVLSYIQQQVSSLPGGKAALTAGDNFALQFANEMLQYAVTHGVNPQAFSGQCSTLLGVSANNPNGVAGQMLFVIETIAGNGEVSNYSTDKSGMAKDPYALGKSSDTNIRQGSGRGGNWATTAQSQSGAGRAYADSLHAGGARNKGIESLLMAVGAKGQDAMQVAVMTATGMRQMSLADAIKNFPNEVAAGNAKIMQGQGKGGLVASLMGDNIVSNVDAQMAERRDTSKGKIGKAVNVNDNSSGSGSSVNVGGVQVTLSAQAQALLQLLPGYNGVNNATGQPNDPNQGPLQRSVG